MEKIRLNKFLSQSGVASRRAAERLMGAGHVKVNGVIVREMGFMINPKEDKVLVGDKPIEMGDEHVYYVLNKPRGYVTTSIDPFRRKKVVDLVPKTPRVYPVGRLDYDTSGLLILTNDGELTHKLTHPKFEKEKEYAVVVKATTKYPISNIQYQMGESIRNNFLKGVGLEEGLAKADKITILEQKGDIVAFSMVIHQGWNRQIRRMCDKVGLKVLSLKRTRFGNLNLGNLKEGAWRELNEKEIKGLQ